MFPKWDMWQSSVIKALSEKGFAKLSKTLEEGIEVAPLYQTGIKEDYSRPLGTSGPWQITQSYDSFDLERLKKILGRTSWVVSSSYVLTWDKMEHPLNTKGALNRLLADVYLEAVTLRFAVSGEFTSFAKTLESYITERGHRADEVDIRLTWTPFAQARTHEKLAELAPLITGNTSIREFLTFSGASVYDAGGSGAKELGFLLASVLETCNN